MNILIKQVLLIDLALQGTGFDKGIQSNLFNSPLKDRVIQNHKRNPFIAFLLICFVCFFLPGFLSGCGAAEHTDAEYVQRAKDYQDQGQLNATIIELKNALIQNPGNPEARLLLGTVYVELGDGATAEKELLRSHELGISSEGIAIPLAKSLLLQRKYSQVIAEINPYGNLHTYDKAQIHALHGNAYIGDNKLDEAAEAYRSAFELEPDLTLAQLGQARLTAIQGEKEEARSWIDKALESDPESAEAWSLLGNIELSAGNAAEAEAAFSNAIELRQYLGSNNIDIAKRAKARIQLEKYPDAEADIKTLKQGGLENHPYVNYIAGLSYFEQQNYPEAAAAFEASHNMDPKNLTVEYYLAVSHYLMGNLEQANDNANRLLNRAPQSLATHRLMGAIFISSSEYDAAMDVLQKALDKSPDNEVILKMLANASLLKGDTAQGVKFHEKIVSLDPESTQAKNGLRLARLMHGQSLDTGITDDNLRRPLGEGDNYSRDFMFALEAFKEGNLVLALERAQKLHAQYPDKVDPLNLLSAVYLGSAMWANARTELEKVLALDPKEPSALMNLAKVEVETGNLERARTLLRELLVVQPNNERAILLLAKIEAQLVDQEAGIQVLKQAVEHNPNALSLRAELAARYLRAGDAAKILEVTNNLTDKQFQELPGLLELRGKAQGLEGDQTAARHTFQRWSQLAPDSAQAHYHYANSLVEIGKIDHARKELALAIQLNPGYVRARIGEIKLLVKAGEQENAGKMLANLKRDFGERFEVLGIEGWFSLGTGDYTTAEDSLSAALEMKQNREIMILLSFALRAQQKEDEAITLLQEWLKEHPRDVAVMLKLADTYKAQNNDVQARTTYANVVELYPNHVDALNNLAWLSQDKDPKQALDYAERAYELLPNNPLVLDTYGMLLMKNGETSRGHEMLQSAAKTSPNDTTIQLHLGQSLIQQEKFSEAQTVLSALIEASPDTSSANEAKALLESIPRQ